MNDEQKLIWQMLKDGKITAEEAEKLMENLPETTTGVTQEKSLNRKFLKVSVAENNIQKVNMNIPLALAEVGLKLVPKDALKIEGQLLQIEDLLTLIQEGHIGELVNVNTTDNEKDVQIRISIE